MLCTHTEWIELQGSGFELCRLFSLYELRSFFYHVLVSVERSEGNTGAAQSESSSPFDRHSLCDSILCAPGEVISYLNVVVHK